MVAGRGGLPRAPGRVGGETLRVGETGREGRGSSLSRKSFSSALWAQNGEQTGGAGTLKDPHSLYRLESSYQLGLIFNFLGVRSKTKAETLTRGLVSTALCPQVSSRLLCLQAPGRLREGSRGTNGAVCLAVPWDPCRDQDS